MLQKMVTSFARVGGYIKPCLHLNEPCYVASSQNRLYANLKMTKTAGKKFQVIHVKLSVSDEKRAKWKAQILFRCLRILTDVMRSFLSYHGLMNSPSIKVHDSQGFLYAIKQRLNLPNFLNSNGHSKTQIKRIVKKIVLHTVYAKRNNEKVWVLRFEFVQFEHSNGVARATLS